MSAENTPAVEATPESGAVAEVKTSKEGNVSPVKTYTQDEFDSAAGKARRNGESDGEKKILKQLNVKSVEDLDKVMKAYQDSLSAEEKRANEMASILEENNKLKATLDEKEYAVVALAKAGSAENLDDIIAMAKAVKKDDMTKEQAVDKVLSMLQANKPAPTLKSDPLPPTQGTPPAKNPFIDNDEQEICKLYKENPVLAKKMAKEVGLDIDI